MTHRGVDVLAGRREAGGWGCVQTGMGSDSFEEVRAAPTCSDSNMFRLGSQPFSSHDDRVDELGALVKASKLYKDEHTFNFTLHSYWLLTEDEISPDRIPVVRRWVSLVNLALASCK